MRASVVSHGLIHDLDYAKKIMKDSDIIICADGGAEYVLKCGLIPYAVVGDLDSIETSVLEKIKSSGCRILKYPKEKDYTDTQLAVNYAIEAGASEITMLGSIGNRIDHTLANVLYMVKLLDKGIKVSIINENNTIYITNGTINLKGNIGDIVSLIPVGGDVYGVKTDGLKYKLDGSTLTLGDPLGISNIFLREEASISVEKGYLLVIKSRD